MNYCCYNRPDSQPPQATTDETTTATTTAETSVVEEESFVTEEMEMVESDGKYIYTRSSLSQFNMENLLILI